MICEINNKPYDRWWYAKLARRVREAAGLPKHLRIGDLRRTGTTRLANNNCTEDELMSVTGHKSREVVSVYVKRSKEMAQNAILQSLVLMEYDPIVIELKDGEVVLYLAQPVGETEYLIATLYKQGTLLSQHKINEIRRANKYS